MSRPGHGDVTRDFVTVTRDHRGAEQWSARITIAIQQGENMGNEIVRREESQSPSRLPSEDIVVAAPMSYAGSAARIWKITRRAGDNLPATIGLGALAVVLMALAWVAVTLWYLIFWVFLIPYRLVRRGQRKRKLEDARHRELLQVMGDAPQGTDPRNEKTPGDDRG